MAERYRNIVVVRGAGDLATGVIQAFYRAGIRVLALEAPCPTAIRRSVALCEAVYDGAAQVEDVPCRLIHSDDEMAACHREGVVPLMVDPEGGVIHRLRPKCVVDAIIAKRNMGTHRGMAPITIALGPGFAAGQDADVVIETVRGHDLGRLIFEGTAQPNTGVPGNIAGYARERVVHAPVAGVTRNIKRIGDVVHEGEAILIIEQHFVKAPFNGLLRGLIRSGLSVPKGMKIADIDPRVEVDCNTVSDKARSLGGSALTAYMMALARMDARK